MARNWGQAARIWGRIYGGILGTVDGGEGSAAREKRSAHAPRGSSGAHPFCPSRSASPELAPPVHDARTLDVLLE